MTPATNYLIEVSVNICVVYLLYALLFKGKTFFQLNRIYLVGGLLISFFLPVIDLPNEVTRKAAPLTILSVEQIQTEYVPLLFESNNIGQSSGNLTAILSLGYCAGVAFFLFRFLYGVWNIIVLKRRSSRSKSYPNVYIQESLPTFSFFNIVFARPDVDRLVIDHEQIHILQMHWIDILLAEFASILLWFNPVLIWYKKAIKAQHEYLADQGVMDAGRDPSAYMTCLVRSAYTTNGIPGTSHFASHSIKNRIIMMTKTKTHRLHTLLYLLILPTVALLLFSFQDSGPLTRKTPAPEYVLPNQTEPDGTPIEKAKLKVTYGFGEKFNPVTNKMQTHTGMDFLTDGGVNVMATADGIVIDATFDEIKGNYVVIRHSDHFTTQYFHMKSLTVKKGVMIRKGEVVGFVGSTGLSIREHLHYEVLKDGKAVDPIEYLPKEFSDRC